MTPQEREMLNGLFGRLKQNEPTEKDAEAANLIRDSLARQPGSAYTLVQAVMVQEHALNEAGQRIQALEKELSQARATQPAPAGLLGAKPTARPWDRPASSVPPPQSALRPVAAPQLQPAMAQPQSGSFMRTALGAAAGFVGGALLMKSLEGMFNGQSGQAHASEMGATPLPEARPEPEAWHPVQEHADFAGADAGEVGGDDNF